MFPTVRAEQLHDPGDLLVHDDLSAYRFDSAVMYASSRMASGRLLQAKERTPVAIVSRGIHRRELEAVGRERLTNRRELGMGEWQVAQSPILARERGNSECAAAISIGHRTANATIVRNGASQLSVVGMKRHQDGGEAIAIGLSEAAQGKKFLETRGK